MREGKLVYVQVLYCPLVEAYGVSAPEIAGFVRRMSERHDEPEIEILTALYSLRDHACYHFRTAKYMFHILMGLLAMVEIATPAIEEMAEQLTGLGVVAADESFTMEEAGKALNIGAEAEQC